MKQLYIILIALTMSSIVMAKEYHVTKTGNDRNKGTIEMPLLTIQAAANLAQPGDIITVHEGIYREEIIPPVAVNQPKNQLFTWLLPVKMFLFVVPRK